MYLKSEYQLPRITTNLVKFKMSCAKILYSFDTLTHSLRIENLLELNVKISSIKISTKIAPSA